MTMLEVKFTGSHVKAAYMENGESAGLNTPLGCSFSTLDEVTCNDLSFASLWHQIPSLVGETYRGIDFGFAYLAKVFARSFPSCIARSQQQAF